MDMAPLTGLVGAELSGIDLAAPIEQALAGALRDALAISHVIVVRDQHLTIDQQRALTTVFGAPAQLPYVTPMDGHPDVIAVLKEADEVDGGVFGGDWHSDFSFLANPPAGSVLSAVEVPPVGGDTVWANQEAAYRTLPERLREIVDGVDGIHTGAPYGVTHAPPENHRSGASITMRRGDPDADREVRHPAVITSPITGARALFLNPIYTTRLSTMSHEDSAPVLAELYRHATRPDVCCRHRWRAGDVVVWNNRTTLHYATNDYDGHRRLLHRTAFDGAPPVGSRSIARD
ncbi:MAG: TauD/TfdA family dioxygenase [Ilumatobacteraceae bacterium]